MIKMVVVPLVFFSLVVECVPGRCAKAGPDGRKNTRLLHGDHRGSPTIGVGLASLIDPVISSARRTRHPLEFVQRKHLQHAGECRRGASFTDHSSPLPTNPFAALGSGDMLQVIFFAMMLGIALTFLKDNRAEVVVDLFDRLNEAMVMLVHIMMKIAPYGVGALLFKVVGNAGIGVLFALSVYALVVLMGLLLHLILTYGTVVRLWAKLPFLAFLGAIKEAMVVAFSTSGSSATLPVTKECCEDNLNVKPRPPPSCCRWVR